MVLAILLWCAWRQGRTKSALVAIAAVFLIQVVAQGAWMTRNHFVAGTSSFAGESGSIYLTGYFVPQIKARTDGTSYGEAKRVIMESIQSSEAYIAASNHQKNVLMMDYARNAILENFGTAILIATTNIPKMFLSFSSDIFRLYMSNQKSAEWSRINEAESSRTYDSRPFDILDKIRVAKTYLDSGLLGPVLYGFIWKALMATVIILSVAGVVIIAFRSNQNLRFWAIFLVLWVGLMIVITAPAGAARFRLPVSPLVFISAMVCAEAIWRKVRHRLAGGLPVGR